METKTGADLARYRLLRARQKELHDILMRRLPKGAIEEGGRRLGIYRDGILVFDSLDESSVLMDYCIFDYRWDGKNVIERYRQETQLEPQSAQQVLLHAMLEARYSLFAVDEAVSGVGVNTRDLLRGDEGFMMDIRLSGAAAEGLVFAGRVITPEDCNFSMTTGAALPADRPILKRIIDEYIPRLGGKDIARITPAQAAELSAFIIRICLEGGASSHVKYGDPPQRGNVAASRQVGRNDPCPCGSGKKYKRCCGR